MIFTACYTLRIVANGPQYDLDHDYGRWRKWAIVLMQNCHVMSNNEQLRLGKLVVIAICMVDIAI
jgi:hypothetical protein